MDGDRGGLARGRLRAHARRDGRSGAGEAPGAGRLLPAAERPEGRALARHHLADRDDRGLLPHRVPHRAEGPDRVRAPVRARDVPGLGEPREDGVRQARHLERRRAQRLDPVRLHELLRDRPRERDRADALGRGGPDARPRGHPGEPREPAGRGEERGPGERAQPALRRLPLARPAAGREHELVQRPQLLRRPRRSRRGDARRREGVLQDLLRAEQRRARGQRRLRPRAGEGVDREVLRRDPRGRAAAEARPARARADRGEAAGQGRPARPAARARGRLPPARRRHARVLRDGAARRAAPAGHRLRALPVARAEAGADRRRRGRHEPARQPVQLRRPDALVGVPLPRQGQDAGPAPRRDSTR